jgi:hypothetical protein
MDDEISRDHHWGPSVDVLLPEAVLRDVDTTVWRNVATALPLEFHGFHLEAGPVGIGGLNLESRESFLGRTIGRTTSPATYSDWLELPEEDIVHVTNGEVWHDPSGEFTEIRETLKGYYPDLVWKRRIAHWCRYCSGMGLYALHRALLRNNWPYAYWTFARTLKLTMEIGFLLNRTYFPYDKWLFPMFQRLPHLQNEMTPLISEATNPSTDWQQRCSLIATMHDILDARMVDLGLVRRHPRFAHSQTSGYRLLEFDYREILLTIPPELRHQTPLWDQRFFEGFVSGLVTDYTEEQWTRMLNLIPQQ